MPKGKTGAQLRADILADIEAVRFGKMPASTAAVIFDGYDKLTKTMATEIAHAKLCIATEGKAHSFGKVVKLGSLVFDEAEE